MNRVFTYFRLQYRLLGLLLLIVVPLGCLSLDIVKIDLFSAQVLLFAVLMFTRFFLGRVDPIFLHLDLKNYLHKKLKRVPSKKDIAQWEYLNREAQDAIFILVGLFILGLKFL